MRTLEHIKDDYAIQQGFANWYELLTYCNEKYLHHYITEVMILAQKQALQNASDNVKTKLKDNVHELSMNDDWSEIDKESITNENNIIR